MEFPLLFDGNSLFLHCHTDILIRKRRSQNDTY